MGVHDLVTPAPGVPYFIPKVPVISGKAIVSQSYEKTVQTLPKAFQPLKVKGLKFQNRIGVSPMCMYSANKNFEVTPFHLVHYGSLLLRGPAITFVESTSVSPEGGLSPQDLAIFNDEQALKLKDIVDFAHTQNQNIAIQIGHGGRKSSGLAGYVHLEYIAEKEDGGWPDKVVAPSPIQYRDGGSLVVPKELSVAEIERIIADFGSAAKRAVEISGFDAIEIHGAHGYLINEFLSEISNKRTDKYGGSFENRIRFLLEVIGSVKSNVPSEFPVFLRISASENTIDDPLAWTIEDSIKLADVVVEKGIDLIDVSSGGNNSNQNARGPKEALHAELARAIKKSIGDRALVACVGKLNRSELVNQLLEEGAFDLALIGTQFLENPGVVHKFATELGVEIDGARQYAWASNPDYPQILKAIDDAKSMVEEKRKNL
ncbi:probable NADPH dehydrogenase [[Candida] anglica]|uniref:Probable NADPH dehydrogenase n=1 Tax=[Candida] anglica TaxID=148631 RepID=A0ABP0EPD7_9ASCO